jgi:hypothetical protein
VTSVETGPIGITEAWFSALAQRRWLEAAALVDLAALESYHELVSSYVSTARGGRLSAVETLQATDPDMPVTVVEYFANRVAQDLEGERDWLTQRFGDISSLNELTRLPALQLAARTLQAHRVRKSPEVGVQSADTNLDQSGDDLISLDPASVPSPKYVDHVRSFE